MSTQTEDDGITPTEKTLRSVERKLTCPGILFILSEKETNRKFVRNKSNTKWLHVSSRNAGLYQEVRNVIAWLGVEQSASSPEHSCK